ncbi:zf-HC2 domain-containing protein [Paludisphaera mucosa]|uniref:Zf-HC2 domain-containing protein n=1 Tax=Paludisphaera mucosa TaxID=3030827 RepID=A0ABT6FJR7_9BACT|nr:zf-HC2 domain-containing protein [Paludisphaera mucosa]MDG3007827.1 zf-HC2 domain-containing protein [Paludisphaera mucosa]
MKRTPDETACAWVRDRLPLFAADEDDPAPTADAGPARDERIAVEAHLERCAACRGRRDGLALAFDALAAAAAESPAEPHAPSLWPALQARIEAQAGRPRTRRAGEAAPGARSRGPLERAASRLAGVRDDLPLQRARIGDSAREQSPARLRAWLAPDRLLRPLAGPVGALAAAALAAIAVGLPLAQRLRDDSQGRIDAAATPLPALERAIPLVVTPPRADVIEAPVAEPGDLALVNERSLAQNTEPPLRDPDNRGLDVARPAPPPPATAPAVRFDLERGTPMPPDTLAGKPAY